MSIASIPTWLARGPQRDREREWKRRRKRITSSGESLLSYRLQKRGSLLSYSQCRHRGCFSRSTSERGTRDRKGHIVFGSEGTHLIERQEPGLCVCVCVWSLPHSLIRWESHHETQRCDIHSRWFFSLCLLTVSRWPKAPDREKEMTLPCPFVPLRISRFFFFLTRPSCYSFAVAVILHDYRGRESSVTLSTRRWENRR